jgi:hypothetical protein
MKTLAQYVLPTIPSRSLASAGAQNLGAKHAELDMVFHFELMLLDAAREGNAAPPPMSTGDHAADTSGEGASGERRGRSLVAKEWY